MDLDEQSPLQYRAPLSSTASRGEEMFNATATASSSLTNQATTAFHLLFFTCHPFRQRFRI